MLFLCCSSPIPLPSSLLCPPCACSPRRFAAHSRAHHSPVLRWPCWCSCCLSLVCTVVFCASWRWRRLLHSSVPYQPPHSSSCSVLNEQPPVVLHRFLPVITCRSSACLLPLKVGRILVSSRVVVLQSSTMRLVCSSLASLSPHRSSAEGFSLRYPGESLSSSQLQSYLSWCKPCHLLSIRHHLNRWLSTFARSFRGLPMGRAVSSNPAVNTDLAHKAAQGRLPPRYAS